MHYVYRLVNNDSRIIYVGRCKSLDSRLKQHSHLPKEAYDEVARIEYIESEQKTSY